MYYQRYPRLRFGEVTPLNVSNSAKALARQKEKAGLFVDQIAWPTPEERIEALRVERRGWERNMRSLLAKHWRKARRLLRELPEPQQSIARSIWQSQVYPGSGDYLIELCRRIADGSYDRLVYEHHATLLGDSSHG